MHQSLRGRIVGALIYYYFADASTICDASMHDSGPCPRHIDRFSTTQRNADSSARVDRTSHLIYRCISLMMPNRSLCSAERHESFV